MKLQLMEIERFAIHDGPGIRSTVFLQGCPLRCPWCANPESWTIGRHLMYLQKKCVGCGSCAVACPHGCITMSGGRPKIDRQCCRHCGTCADACLSHALRISGREMTVEAVVEVLVRDRTYYELSGGGITVSGGEPLTQGEGVAELLRQCKAQGLHTAAETTGNVPVEAMQKVLPNLDLVLFDLKHPDETVLRDATKGELSLILQNLRSIPPEKVILRVPVIPGFNQDTATLRRIFQLAQDCGITRIDLLPYHTLGKGKYDQLDLPWRMGEAKPLKTGDLNAYREMGRAMGLDVR